MLNRNHAPHAPLVISFRPHQLPSRVPRTLNGVLFQDTPSNDPMLLKYFQDLQTLLPSP